MSINIHPSTSSHGSAVEVEFARDFEWDGIRAHGWLVLFVSLVIYGSPLVAPFPLLDPDEGMHAAIALEMVESSDWITPRYRGVPFFDKPVLFFWMQGLSLSLFGASTTAIRLPGLFCGWLGGLTTGWLGARLFGREVGRVAALMQWTMILPLSLAQAAVHDVALVPFCNLALLCLWESSRDSTRRGWRWTWGAGVLLGLACLAKGLLGWPLIGLGFVFTLFLTRTVTFQVILRGLLALLIGLCVASPWYLAMDRANPGFLWYYFVERHVLGFATATQHHGNRSVWYYVPILIGGSLPWGLLVPMGLLDVVQRVRTAWSRVSHEEWLTWMWLLGSVGFLSLARSKLFTYLSPVFPAMALLAARFLVSTWGESLSPGMRARFRRATWLSWIAILLGTPFGLYWAVRKLPDVVGPIVLMVAIGLYVVLWIPFWMWWHGRERESFRATLIFVGLLFVGVTRLVVPTASDRSVQHLLAIHLNELPEFPPQVWIVEERLGSVYFYLRSELRRSLTNDRIHFVEFDHPPVWESAADGVEVVVPRSKVDRFQRLIVADHFQREEVGHYCIFRRVRRVGEP